MAEYALLGQRLPKPDALNRVTGRMGACQRRPDSMCLCRDALPGLMATDKTVWQKTRAKRMDAAGKRPTMLS
jgi:hypothetical protein